MKAGRRPTFDGICAQDYGITVRQVRQFGGAERLNGMSPEARAALFTSHGGSQKKISMRDLGMESRVPGRLRSA